FPAAATAARPPFIAPAATSPPAPVPAPVPALIPAPSPAASAVPGEQTSRLSIAALMSLILAFVPFLLVSQMTSLILGIIGLKRIARSKGALHGRGLAIAGITVSTILLFLILAAVTVALVIPALSGRT